MAPVQLCESTCVRLISSEQAAICIADKLDGEANRSGGFAAATARFGAGTIARRGVGVGPLSPAAMFVDGLPAQTARLKCSIRQILYFTHATGYLRCSLSGTPSGAFLHGSYSFSAFSSCCP